MTKYEIEPGNIVTINFKTAEGSNTFIVRESLPNGKYLLFHPLYDKIHVVYDSKELNNVQPNIKDSTERALDFINANLNLLSYYAKEDFESLCMTFIVRRRLTPKQKHIMSCICGNIASIKFSGNLQQALLYIEHNIGVLDEFNSYWYNNISNLLKTKHTLSKNQKTAIFNIAGVAMAELENPSVSVEG